ncbi:hypothetical protein GALMADRAFT_257573 [Galerina marginata CBS 339.88]|uniref:Uncharacterized protein n=1 Tax=Galerina marginata (strain CBS 339.88) TaxID=685588 RepID=A0A067SAY2_GALM3|nr:hypothetical protein GALMADRAFT_257573 [Galerina marginata CBS 339.88]
MDLSFHASQDPVTLTWDPDALDGGSIQSPDQHEDNRDTSTPVVAAPSGPPPSYSVARIPDHPVTYTFSRLGNGTSAMILVPPPSSPDTRPAYHISVAQDPFMPACFITSMVRGGDQDGPSVGGFRTITGIGPLQNNAETVWIRDCEHPMRSIFSAGTNRKKELRNFQWYSFNPKRSLVWSCPTWPQVGTFSCHRPAEAAKTLAQFSPVNQLIRRGVVPDEIKLTVMPIGHPMFDDILLSALLLERHRLTDFYTIPYQRQF